MKLGLLLKGCAAVVPLLLMLPAAPAQAQAAAASGPGSCQLPSATGVRHVIYVQFDNVHLRRDNPNVPSDLEQMPNLLNFLQGNGALLDNHHTPLIAHTADDILTSMTGLYGAGQGNPVANSYLEYTGANGTPTFASSFQYWTGHTADGTPNMLSSTGQNAPAPWTAFTRAGCNVGAVGTANIELEGLSDVAQVFGPGSPQAAEVASHSPNAFPDFVGISVHCARSAELCSSTNNGVTDRLPNEPGGYQGFNALFGHKYVAPQISPNGPLTDLDGNVIADRFGGNTTPGFPGFDGLTPSVSLAYTAAMQEHGVPVTMSYISAAHVDASGNDAGPGQADYVARLHAYDEAWGKFFSRLAHDGITKDNSLFVITSDENDHFAGGAPTPAGCNGVTTPCTYSQIGEVNTNLQQLMHDAGNTTLFGIHFDGSPAIYLNGQPAPDAAVSRSFERTLAGLQVTNPISGNQETLVNYLVDPAGMGLLHMVTADPERTPTMVAFAKPDYYVTNIPADCPGGPVVECPPSFGSDAWMHGTIAPEINRTWLGLVGPGVRHVGRTDGVWSDHTDIRSTMLLLTGLQDRYANDGRPLFELLTDQALPQAVRAHEQELLRLAQAFKQINAPVGELGLTGARISTEALSGNDHRYASLEHALAQITTQRDALAGQMQAIINGAVFSGRSPDAGQSERLVNGARELLQQATELSESGQA